MTFILLKIFIHEKVPLILPNNYSKTNTYCQQFSCHGLFLLTMI